jgi:hypothetical protein
LARVICSPSSGTTSGKGSARATGHCNSSSISG